jgi:hypothetical protein
MLWSKELTHFEQDCHILEDYEINRSYFPVFSLVLLRVAGKIVNDVLYP